MVSDTIVLWGLSGAGKSSVGRALATLLDRPFVDTDDLIEAQSGRTIPEIFARDGEERFRSLEAAAVARAMAQPGTVVAVGGGAVVLPGNRALLATGRTVWLHAPVGELARRVAAGTSTIRPLLAGDPTTRLAALAEQRVRWYRRAETSVSTESRSPVDAARQIAGLIQYDPTRHPQRLEIQSAGGTYTVVSGQGSLSVLPEALHTLKLPARIWLVSDETIMAAHAGRVCEALSSAGFTVHSLAVPAGEESKGLRQAARLWDWLADGGAERSEAVIAVGGGVVGDLVGFVAATYLRGVPLIQVATSLLSQVDSSIGGKTAIDHPQGKNLIGAFYPARLVVVDTALLHGLPPDHVAAGWAEVLKMGVIMDPELFDFMLAHGEALSNLSPAHTLFAIRRSLALKARVVEADERENRFRMILNFGHTVGHALEASTAYRRFLHGHGVALGMLAAGWMAAELGTWTWPEYERLQQGIALLGLPGAAADIDVQAVVEATLHDKKVRGRRVQWILPTRIGDVTITDAVPETLVVRALSLLRDGALAARSEVCGDPPG